MVKNVILAGVFLVGGFALSSWWTTRGHHAVVPSASPQTERPEPGASSPSVVDLAAVRSLMREELQQAFDKRAAGAGARAASDDGPRADDPSAPMRARGHAPPTPAQEAAHGAAATLVDAGLTLGRWTEQDELAWQELEEKLTPDAAQEVRGRLFEAVNEGRVVAELRFARRIGAAHPTAVQTP